MSDCGLINFWREMNPEKVSFTWTRSDSNQRTRLELFSNFRRSFKVDVLPSYGTDHSMVLLSFRFDQFYRGHLYWKFNNSYLGIKGMF